MITWTNWFLRSSMQRSSRGPRRRTSSASTWEGPEVVLRWACSSVCRVATRQVFPPSSRSAGQVCRSGAKCALQR